ncbi:MAG: YCF48-related protein [Cyclobacteriaceae bacterium]
MKRFFFYSLCLLLLVSSCQPSEQPEQQNEEHEANALRFRWELMDTPTQASLRGLSTVSTATAWASGQYGTILRTTDGGNHWEQRSVPGIDSADFRDVEAISENVAYVLAAGSPAYIFKTTDGGETWAKQYENTSPDIFLDGMAFWDEQHGIVMGDPMDGYFTILRTEDGGQTWERVPSENLPSPQEGEAGFAASGTNIIARDNRYAWIATGGGASRVLRSSDRGKTWEASPTPMTQGAASQGIFSFTFTDSLRGVAVGGDYQSPEVATQNASYTTDGGRTWQLAENPPRGYRSGVAYLSSVNTYIAVGPGGSDYSSDGIRWHPLDSVGYHSIQSRWGGKAAWVSGSDGRIARVTW